MTKRFILIIGVEILALCLAPSARPASTVPEPCLKSTLCNGLIEIYELDEGSDSVRFGAFMGQLHEPVPPAVATAQNVSSNATTKKTGTASLELAGTTSSYLWANGGAGLPATTAFWLYLDGVPSVGQSMVIVSRRDTTRAGPDIYVANNGSGSAVMCVAYFSVDEISNVSVCSSTFSTAAWHHFVVGIGLFKNAEDVVIGSSPYVNLDGGTKVFSASTIGFSVHQGSWQVRIGNGTSGAGPDSAGANALDGKLDQLAFWSRELTESEIDLLYGTSGAGLAYPFSTE